MCAKATNNQLLTELKIYFFIKTMGERGKNLTLRHTITKPHMTLSHIQYVLQQVQKKMSPTHTWTHFWKKKKKNLSFSLWFSTSSIPLHPLPFSLYRCGYLISTIDTKFLFLITIVLCCAKVRHLVDESKTKRKDFFKGKTEGCKDRGQRRRFWVFFSILCEKGRLTACKRKSRELLKRRTEALSVGISCQNSGALFRMSSENG